MILLSSRKDEEVFGPLVRQDGNQVKLLLAYKEGQLLFLHKPIEVLAHGWMAIIKVLQEIVSSISAWERVRDSTDILGSDALIFIDEIDAHLHPRWQAQLVPFLKKVFPKATFFLATHSPLVVRDTEPGEVYELVKSDTQVTTRRLGSPRNWFLADIYAHAFHVELPPPGSESSPGLESMLMDFMEKVRAFTAGGESPAREEALKLYEKISPSLLEDDPRRQTLEQLREMLG